MPGEFDFIRWVMTQSSANARVLVPPGDDLAVLKWDAADLLIVGADQVLDGVHFDSKIHSPRAIGRKVMNRNLSDCAAMACLPTAAVATAALPKGIPLEDVKELYKGMTDAGAEFDCPIVGGDTATWDGKLVLTLTILGKQRRHHPHHPQRRKTRRQHLRHRPPGRQHPRPPHDLHAKNQTSPRARHDRRHRHDRSFRWPFRAT